ncbi:class I SAM-dependent methyltransferase [Candidatus Pelagibacter sp.]|nr:class I SAM-dependent methyltransferase [Candidatus Pelagibacter sp.]
MNFNCRVCNSSKLKKIIDLGMQPWGNDFIKISQKKKSKLYPLNFVICKECKTCQIDHTIPKEKMFINHSYMSGTTKTLRNHFKDLGKKILKESQFRENDYILDIGGNDGTFLEFFKEKNIKVLNVDSGKQQSVISNSKGINCLNNFFNEKLAKQIIENNDKAKIIHGSGIFFHLEDLKSVFKGIKSLLKDDGTLVAEFIYLPSMIQNLAFDQIYHEHLLYYSLSTFQNLLNEFNLEIIDAEKVSIHGGSCITYIKHKDAEVKKSLRFKTLLEDEKSKGFLNYEIYANFASKVYSLKNQMHKLINKIKDEKKKIYALGAPVKGTTLLNFMELNENHIDCAVEINKHKFNTFYPGTKIPVLNQDDISDPDYYLFLSWNFKKEIIEKMGNFVDKGGRYIIPFPKLKII